MVCVYTYIHINLSLSLYIYIYIYIHWQDRESLQTIALFCFNVETRKHDSVQDLLLLFAAQRRDKKAQQFASSPVVLPQRRDKKVQQFASSPSVLFQRRVKKARYIASSPGCLCLCGSARRVIERAISCMCVYTYIYIYIYIHTCVYVSRRD